MELSTIFPWVYADDWFQDPPQIPKSKDAQIPEVKWHSIVNVVSPPYQQMQNHFHIVMQSLLPSIFRTFSSFPSETVLTEH